MRYQGHSKRRPTGGKRNLHRKRKRFELGFEPTHTLLGEVRRTPIKGLAGSTKNRLYQSNVANVLDPKTGKLTKVKIETVVENKANPYFVRRNIITKGAVIKTEAGNARVTSRPGQDGVVNAVLIA